MRDNTIERKITIFISSLINERYSIVRKALKILLLETGMVAYVYAFESEGACSQDVKSAYLKEVSLSDLCVFLIDNADGVSDAVFAEHERASREGIHRLYFFCDEKEKNPTFLQNKLMNTGETKYNDKIHEFSDFPKETYSSVLQDIIDLYRGSRIVINDADEKSVPDIVSVNTLVLRKDIYKHYTAESRLARVFNPYGADTPYGVTERTTPYDELCAEFLSTVIGRSAFNHDKFMQLKSSILPTHEENIKNIIELRLNAIADYYSNKLDDCYHKIHVAYEKAKEIPNVPMWLLNDIAIDMRNISSTIDNINNRITLKSNAQKILDESPEAVYYPLLDRFDNYNNSELLKEYFEMNTQSPYSQRFGILSHAFDYIASCFNVAIRFGSLTHILITPTRYGDTLITKFIDSGDFKLFFELIRISLITPEKKLNKIVSTYNKNVSAVTAAEIEILINSIKTIPLEYNKIISICLLIEHFGYYFSEEQYNVQIDFFFQYAHNWCIEEKRIVNVGDNILKAVQANLMRMNNQRVAELLNSFFENHIGRFYNEVLKILSRLNYKQVNEMDQTKIVEHCIALISEKSYPDIRTLQLAAIAIRKSMSQETDLLDDAVREYMPEFYDKEYDLEINKTNMLKHIEDYIVEIHQRNQVARASTYTGYSNNPCDIIRMIIILNDIGLSEDDVTKIMTAIEETLLNKVQQADQKNSAIQLAFCLYCTFSQFSLWDGFKKRITEKSADVLSATFDSFLGTASQNSLKLNFLLMKIGFGVCSFEEAAIGFATVMSYNESDFITAVHSIYIFLSDADITILDDNILGIITNFILAIGEEKHKNAQFYAINSLILLSKSDLYAAVVLERLAYMMNGAISDIKFSILRGIRDLENKDKGIKNYILQKGRTDNHYLVRNLAEEITESLSLNKAEAD
jgi:hypothetical protein